MFTIDYNYLDFIIRIELKGNIQIEEINEMAKTLKENTQRDVYYFLSDARNATYSFGVDDIQNLEKMLYQYINPQITKYEALIINKPLDVAKSTLFNKERAGHNFKSKIFSTEEAAIEWLKSLRGYKK